MPLVFRDGTVLPSGSYQERFRTGRWNRVPVVLGTNRDENKLFMFASPVWVRRWFGVVPRLREPASRYDAVAEYLARMWKAAGADEVATAMHASGASDVYVYRFDWDEEPTVLGADLSQMLGACHGFEIPFVFGHFDLGAGSQRLFTPANAPGRTELAAAMTSYWTAFAASGRPGRGRGDDLVAWPAWDDAATFLVLDTSASGGVRPATGAVTRDDVLAGIERDPRLPTARDRCLVYHDLVLYTDTVTPADFTARCPGLPFDGYPWRT